MMYFKKIKLLRVKSQGEFETQGEKWEAFFLMSSETCDKLTDTDIFTVAKASFVSYVITEYDLENEDSVDSLLNDVGEGISYQSDDWLFEFIEDAFPDIENEKNELTDYLRKIKKDRFEASHEIITAFIFSEDNQDGSSSPRYFGSEEEMETYADKQDQRFGEDTATVQFVVENGILKPINGFDE